MRAILGLLCLIEILWAGSAFGATLTIDTLSDGASGCTLRAAIEAANANANNAQCTASGAVYGTDTIQFAGGLEGTINLTGSLPPISDDLAVSGPGADRIYVKCPWVGRIFTVAGSRSLTVRGLTLLGNWGANPANQDNGRAVSVGAAGSAVIEECLIMAHVTPGSGDTGNGGAVYANSGSVTIRRSRIHDNGAQNSGGAVFVTGSGGLIVEDSLFEYNAANVDGGAILVDGGINVTISRTIFRNNAAGRGGGLFLTLSAFFTTSATLTDTRIQENNAIATGGGLQLEGNSLASAKLLRTTLSENVAGTDGGAVYSPQFSDIALLMANTTISGNRADGSGGGIYFGSGQAVLANVTITGNTANADASGTQKGGGFYASSSINLKNSIVADNTALAVSTGFDCYGGVLSGGHSIIGSGDGCSISPAGIDSVGSLLFIDPFLYPLALNGGITPTHAEESSASPSWNYVGGSCTWDHDANPGTAEEALTQDQRGRSRDPWCDSGSYEYSHCDNGFKDLFIEDGVDCGGAACAPCTCAGSPPAHIRPGSFYGTVQTAYDYAYPGALIKILELTTPVLLDLNRNIYLRYSLGEDCDRFKNRGATPFQAPFVVDKGAFVLEAGTMVIE